ncbi:MAG: putative porin, partial [Burkholderiales bacterium]
SLVIDRASLNIDLAPWLSLTGGRFRNPFVGTDLLWSDYLNFEGAAMTLKPQLIASTATFLTAGWFPLSLGVPNQSKQKSMLGIQGGVDWQFGTKDNHFKLATGFYDYRNIEGVLQTQASYNASAVDYLASQYGPAGYTQYGNTLFRINAPLSIDPGTNWGLASHFRELDVTGTADVVQSGAMHAILTGDVVKNLGFDRTDIFNRTGVRLEDGKSLGYLVKAQYGNPTTYKKDEWNVSLGYRYLGSDAVLDAFTNADFGAVAGLGCTNCKGMTLEGRYGLATNTWLAARWMSTNLIDSMVPTSSSYSPATTKFSTDIIQVDLNTKF